MGHYFGWVGVRGGGWGCFWGGGGGGGVGALFDNVRIFLQILLLRSVLILLAKKKVT